MGEGAREYARSIEKRRERPRIHCADRGSRGASVESTECLPRENPGFPPGVIFDGRNADSAKDQSTADAGRERRERGGGIFRKRAPRAARVVTCRRTTPWYSLNPY